MPVYLPGNPAIVVILQLDLPQWIPMMRIETGGDDDQFRLEIVQRR
jgi:hypothetical protein